MRTLLCLSSRNKTCFYGREHRTWSEDSLSTRYAHRCRPPTEAEAEDSCRIRRRALWCHRARLSFLRMLDASHNQGAATIVGKKVKDSRRLRPGRRNPTTMVVLLTHDLCPPVKGPCLIFLQIQETDKTLATFVISAPFVESFSIVVGHPLAERCGGLS